MPTWFCPFALAFDEILLGDMNPLRRTAVGEELPEQVAIRTGQIESERWIGSKPTATKEPGPMRVGVEPVCEVEVEPSG